MDKQSDNLAKGSRADTEEIARFSKMADTWWDKEGPFKALHAMNTARIQFIEEQMCKWMPNIESSHPFKELNILDAGCGGGILSEALCHHGANLTAVDAAEESIHIAQLHAQKNQLNIDYQLGLIDDMAEDYATYFDIICSLEVVEHIPDINGFLTALEKRLKPGGLLFISTINRTFKAGLLAKYAAEYILNLAPKGTHEWKKFVKPSELYQIGQSLDLSVRAISGMKFDPFKNNWKLYPDVSINYIICLQKPFE